MPKADRILAGLATVFLTVSLAACGGNDSAIATVNGQAISKAQFDSKLESSPAALGTLQQMVRDALIQQYAKNNNITVSDEEIAKREDEIKTNFPQPGQWDEMLKARGLSEKDVHDALQEQIIIDKSVGKNVTISDAEIKTYFDKNHAAFDKPEQVKAKHILVPDLKTADKVEADLKSGKDFAAEAKQYSMDPGSKEKGGDLGYFRRGQMVPAFDKAAFTLPIGQISAPVKSPFGYHIIVVEERTNGTKASLDNSKDRIVALLRQQKEAPLIQPFLQDLQAKANIQVNDPRFASAFPSPAPPAAAPSATAAAPAASPTK